jgi:putative DNA primase/helicase
MDGYGRGFSMIPGRPRSKRPYIKRWAEFEERIATPSEVAEWRSDYPDANPVMVCGRISGLIGLDLDGQEAHDLVHSKYGPLPITVVVASPGGPERYHYWYRYPEELGEVHGWVGSKRGLPHVDLRGDGGYLVYPGAVHSNGKRYEFLERYTPDDRELPEAPVWLKGVIQADNNERKRAVMEFELAVKAEEARRRRIADRGGNEARSEAAFAARKLKYAQAVLENETSRLAQTAQGGRTEKLLKAAIELSPAVVEGLLPQSIVESALENAARACGLHLDVGGIREIRRTIRNGFRIGQNDRIMPRDGDGVYVPRGPKRGVTELVGAPRRMTYVDDETGEVIDVETGLVPADNEARRGFVTALRRSR